MRGPNWIDSAHPAWPAASYQASHSLRSSRARVPLEPQLEHHDGSPGFTGVTSLGSEAAAGCLRFGTRFFGATSCGERGTPRRLIGHRCRGAPQQRPGFARISLSPRRKNQPVSSPACLKTRHPATRPHVRTRVDAGLHPELSRPWEVRMNRREAAIRHFPPPMLGAVRLNVERVRSQTRRRSYLAAEIRKNGSSSPGVDRLAEVQLARARSNNLRHSSAPEPKPLTDPGLDLRRERLLSEARQLPYELISRWSIHGCTPRRNSRVSEALSRSSQVPFPIQARGAIYGRIVLQERATPHEPNAAEGTENRIAVAASR